MQRLPPPPLDKGFPLHSAQTTSREAFTILEILVATTILAILLVLLLSTISAVSTTWRRSTEKIQSFQGAQLAFDSITHNLSQATLNTYLDYDNATSPQRYLRKSELMFISDAAGSNAMPGATNTGQAIFFQAFLGYSTNVNYSGLESLLNPCGYFVSFTTNNAIPAHVTGGNNPYRYRLMQLLVPSETNGIYQGSYGSTGWFTSYTNEAKPVADNVIALIVRPQDPGTSAAGAPNNAYAYNSTLNAMNNPQPVTANQLPPVVQVTIVAIDESSAKRLENGASQPAAITTALGNRFTDPASYQTDLDALTGSLNSNRINYRVFSSAVPIRESKWTK
jgi:uncharacterized protein (TIGR02599 family)